MEFGGDRGGWGEGDEALAERLRVCGLGASSPTVQMTLVEFGDARWVTGGISAVGRTIGAPAVRHPARLRSSAPIGAPGWDGDGDGPYREGEILSEYLSPE